MTSKHDPKNDSKNPAEIRENISSLKTNVVGLASDIKEAGVEQARVAADYVQDRVESLKDSGADLAKTLEKRVAKKPMQSLAVAFFAGILANIVLGRRG